MDNISRLIGRLDEAVSSTKNLTEFVDGVQGQHALREVLTHLGMASAYSRALPSSEEDAGTPAPYVKLRRVLDRAFDQAAKGKGKDRHVAYDDQRFEDQPICQLQRMYGTGGGFYQVGKKMEESQRMPREQAINELYGGIIYLAAAIIVREGEGDGEE